MESTQPPEAPLAISKTGQLGSLCWSARRPTTPQGDEIEVEVHATGLNFMVRTPNLCYCRRKTN